MASVSGQQILISPVDGEWLVISCSDYGVHLSMRHLDLQACIYVHDGFLEFTCKLYDSG